ncbi:DUF1566 domain-containing protein [Hyphomicrobium sp. MC8b]|uniref:Lcl domain-containing protein n=1 Tax=Hyphomicrobium sp. MC8b TaxID=300273 RepID=UPI00391C2576
MVYNYDYHVLQYCDGDDWIAMGYGGASGVAAEQISVLTTGTTWTVPADWNSANNTIHIFGAGGGGERDAGAGGGGGEYRKLINFSVTPGDNISYSIGAGGIGGISGTSDATDGGNTTFNSNAVIAIGGKRAFNYGDGGAGGAGGTGGAGSIPGGSGGNNDWGKGGGAGGPNGAGASGSPGADASAPGTNGTEIGGLYGAGGGGLGGAPVGGAGGSFGGGGGGGAANGGMGGSGGIVIVYTPAGFGSGGAPDCTDDATATCTLDADRDSGDPQLVAGNIADGVNILGVTGTLAGGLSGPAGCATIGALCADGTVFAGFHPVTQEQLFIPTTDQGTTSTWKTSAGTNDIATDSTYDGWANSNQVPNSTAFPAFKLCKDLGTGGHSDWYLPGRFEMYYLWGVHEMIEAGGNITNFQDFSYWSSSENNNNVSSIQDFASGGQSGNGKTAPLRVRCMRR